MHIPGLWIDERAAEEDVPGVSDRDLTDAATVVANGCVGQDCWIWISHDGLVMFLFSEDGPTNGAGNPFDVLAARLTFANAHLACLHAACAEVDSRAFPCMSVSHLTAVRAEDGIFSSNDGMADALMDMAPGRNTAGWRFGSSPFVEATWVPSRHPVSPAAAQRSIEMVSAIAQGGIECLSRYALIQKAAVALEAHDFALALISSAALLEHGCRRLWADSISVLTQQMGGHTSAHAFEQISLAHLADLLRAVAVLPESLYLKVDRIRKVRNGWAHGLIEPSLDDAVQGLEAAAKVMAAADGLDFVVLPSRGLGGFTF